MNNFPICEHAVLLSVFVCVSSRSQRFIQRDSDAILMLFSLAVLKAGLCMQAVVMDTATPWSLWIQAHRRSVAQKTQTHPLLLRFPTMATVSVVTGQKTTYIETYI